MTRKTIRLVVTMPDPGEWCCDEVSGAECSRFCLTEDGENVCALGFRLDHDNYRRPQSCRDAEVKE